MGRGLRRQRNMKQATLAVVTIATIGHGAPFRLASALAASPGPPAFPATQPSQQVESDTSTNVDPLPGDNASEVITPADTLELTGLQQRFEAVAAKVAPAVVAISAVQSHVADADEQAPENVPARSETSSVSSSFRSEEMNPQKLQEILDQSTRTVGTGFIFDSNGYILTNEHVVGRAEELWVTTADHKVWPAVIVGSDPRADLAVLKIPASGLTPVQFATDQPHPRGQWTIALGNPYGLSTDGDPCMSVGVIAATDRSLPRLAVKEDRLYSRLIQTTAQINPGNSGGPLFDIEGKVIGVNTAVILPQKQTNGIGFAIPITSRIVSEAHALEQGADIVYGYLGVTVTDPTEIERSAAGAAIDAGVRIESTEPDSPAASAALQSGDFLIAFNGQTIRDTDQFVRLVGDAKVGESITMTLLRNGKQVTACATPKRRPPGLAAVTHDTQKIHWRGLWIGPTPAGFGGEAGNSAASLKILSVDDTSPLKSQGVSTGRVISTVAGRNIGTIADLLTVINEVPAEKCIVVLASATTQPAR